jgi:PRTRC genetic system protein E
MKTNFFETLHSLNIHGDWMISIKTDANGQLIVSVLLSREDIGDDASKSVPPMLFKGTPSELDEGFFDTMVTPAQKTSSLFLNMEQFAKELEKAKEKSKIEEEKNKKEKGEKEDRKKKFEAQMKKVAELEEKEKWGEAIGAMPKAENFPDQADEIKKKLEELRKKHGSLELFT